MDSAEFSHTASNGATMNEFVWEYEESPGLVSVKGKLADHITFWEETVKAPAYILDIIQHGYVIPFLKIPTPFFSLTKAQHSIIGTLWTKH